MKEILIKFNECSTESPSEFIRNPFDVFVDGEKIPRLKHIELDFKKYEANERCASFDDFRYKVEQYVDVFGEDV